MENTQQPRDEEAADINAKNASSTTSPTLPAPKVTQPKLPEMFKIRSTLQINPTNDGKKNFSKLGTYQTRGAAVLQ